MQTLFVGYCPCLPCRRHSTANVNLTQRAPNWNLLGDPNLEEATYGALLTDVRCAATMQNRDTSVVFALTAQLLIREANRMLEAVSLVQAVPLSMKVLVAERNTADKF